MIKVQEKTVKIISYCDIPDEVEPAWMEENTANSYITHTLDGEDDDDELSQWIIKNTTLQHGEQIMIHLDW